MASGRRGNRVLHRRFLTFTGSQPGHPAVCDRKLAFLREQLGNSRGRSGRVVACCFVFASEKRIRSDRTRLTRRSRPTHLVSSSVSSGFGRSKGTTRERLARKGAPERYLLCPWVDLGKFRPLLISMSKSFLLRRAQQRRLLCPPDARVRAI